MDIGLIHTASTRPLIIALIACALVSIPFFAILFIIAKKKNRILWYSVAAVLFAIFGSLGLSTNLYWWIPGYICGFTSTVIVLVTLFQAGHESRVKVGASQQKSEGEPGWGTKKLKGRTIREFQSEKNIWDILEQWADTRNYILEKQDEKSRTYKKRGLKPLWLVPHVHVAWNGSRYRLEAWLDLPMTRRIFGLMWFLPREMIIDIRSYWIGFGDWHPMDPRHIASEDVNVLLDMIDAEIDPIP